MKTFQRNKNVHSRLAFVGSGAIYVTVRSAINNFHSQVEWRFIASFFLFIFAFFLFTIVLNSLVEVLKSKIALQVDTKGIVDKVSFAEAGFIAWDKVENVSLGKIKGNDHIIIKLIDSYQPQVNSSIFKRILIKETKRKYGNAIAINKDYVKEDLNIILEAIKEKRGMS